MTAYVAALSGNSLPHIPRAEFPTILDCVQWAEATNDLADCCNIYSASGKLIAKYQRPKTGTYPAAIGVWVNAKIC